MAVRLQDLLEPGEDNPPYEYYHEALEIVDCLKGSATITQETVEDQIANILSKNLEFNYQAGQFSEIADFLRKRIAYIQRYIV